MEILYRKAAKLAGLTRYFTGEPCIRGHVGQRKTSSGSCCTCDRADREARKDELRARHRETSRLWRARHPDAPRAAAKRYRKRHPDRAKKSWNAWVEKNPERREAIKARAKANRYEQHLAECRNRRARKRSAPGAHTAADIEVIAASQGGKCRYCAQPVTRKTRQIDHRQPLVRGGSNDPANLQILCAPCNRKKWAFDPDDYERRIGVAQ